MAGRIGWLALSVVAACGSGGEPAPDCYADPAACLDPSGEHHQYVVDAIAMPGSAREAEELAFDLDGDPDGRADNALGQILATLVASGEGGSPPSNGSAIATGAILVLVDVHAVDPRDATAVGVRVLLGADPMPAPCADATDDVCGRHLTGDGRFVAAEPPDDRLVIGAIEDGRLTAGPGRATVQLAVGWSGDPRVVTLPLIGARIEADITADGIANGRLGGAVAGDVLGDHLLDAFVDAVTEADTCELLTAAHECCPEPGACDAFLCPTFDCPEAFTLDCEPSRSGLRQCLERNDVIQSLFAPDLDLLDADGAFRPRQDGIRDAMSLGIGFTAVPAAFPAP